MKGKNLLTEVAHLTQTSLVVFSNTQEHPLITTATPRWIQIADIPDISFPLKMASRKVVFTVEHQAPIFSPTRQDTALKFAGIVGV